MFGKSMDSRKFHIVVLGKNNWIVNFVHRILPNGEAFSKEQSIRIADWSTAVAIYSSAYR